MSKQRNWPQKEPNLGAAKIKSMQWKKDTIVAAFICASLWVRFVVTVDAWSIR
jgi:hypothetical protein